MRQHIADFNNMDAVTIFKEDREFVLFTTTDKEPHCGFRQCSFRLQRDAISFAIDQYPECAVWVERGTALHRIRKKG